MAIETKEFDPLALASISSGILLVDDFGIMAEAAEWIMGHPVWTHEYPSLAGQMRAAVLAQFPGMPADKEEAKVDWKKLAADVRARYGETVTVTRGSSERAADPLTTLVDAVGPDKPIVVLST